MQPTMAILTLSLLIIAIAVSYLIGHFLAVSFCFKHAPVYELPHEDHVWEESIDTHHEVLGRELHREPSVNTLLLYEPAPKKNVTSDGNGAQLGRARREDQPLKYECVRLN